MGHTLTLPSGWKYPKARDIFRSVTDKHHNGVLRVLSATQDRGVIFRSELDKDIRYASENLSAYKKVFPGNFVIHLRSFQGGIAYSSVKGIISPAYIVLTPKFEICDDYYRYLFVSKDYIKRLMVAVYGIRDGKQISYDSFGMINIPLPPLPEQKRIAEILIEQDKLIALKERLITAKKKQKKWLMQNLLTGKIRLEGFSGEWTEKFLRDIATVNMGQSPNSQNYNTEGIGLPLIQGNADIDNRRTIARIFTSQITKKANLGDIIMSVRAPVGEIAEATFECCIGRGVCAICGSEFVKQLLLYYECNWRKLSQGSTFDSVNGKEIRQLKFKIPLCSEQTAIAERLSAADQEIELLTKELEAQKQVKKYLMQQLLTGKIRVTGGES